MPLKFGVRTAVLSGAVTVDEAGDLAEWLRKTAKPSVNLSRCTHLHTAALQVLLAARPCISQPPADEFLDRWVAPLFAASREACNPKEN